MFFLSALPYPNGFKKVLLELFGAKIGIGLVLKPRVNIHFPWKLEIGDHVWIGEEAALLNFEKLTIGNNVCISQRVFLCGGNHDFRNPAMPYRNGPIVLKDGCWIGACCFVAAGVTVGVDTVVTAGSIVTADLQDNGIYKGDPLMLIKNRW
ncbi:Colanic acid biosynthesis acetyltransferase WcaF [Arcticibacter svalbardensis MN12-7]|uniref:Colanic acid biosynthesis acetyltransferase WcaF n=1 Tax=Arcticibacter svalbardensis MN12-7 TaxID=1150600 RepID=R9GQV6_9SPHI|nr:colanic acid biosynthesis acetyltransferase WcaF [Arcticibacter svalbardensis]EOR94096.1 Colanic acid biosynthesis acetyltransferase WcaF [Arcticibacter svalbardensis MN12-7]